MDLKRIFTLTAGALVALADSASLNASDQAAVDDAVKALENADDSVFAELLESRTEKSAEAHEKRIAALEAKSGTAAGQPAAIIPPESGTALAGHNGDAPVSATLPDGSVNPAATAPGDKLPAHEVDVAAGVVPGLEGGRFGDRETSTSDTGGTTTTFTADPTAPVSESTDPATQADTAAANSVKGDIVPGAVSGPDAAGMVRDSAGQVADAPTGSFEAGVNGMQKTPDGLVSSNYTDPAPKAPGDKKL